MRSIGPEWRNLAEGLLCVETLEAQFRAEWNSRLERAWEKRNEIERRRAREQGYAALITASVVALLLSVVTLILLLFSPLEVVATVFVLALMLPVILGLYGGWSFFHTPDAFLVSSDLSGQWWRTISGHTPPVLRSGPVLPARRYGDEGEEAFVSHLAGALPPGYVAVRGLLVTRNLDADVIVVGPTGIWIYEVKHWSGEITCERGEWRRTKTYRERGGRLVRELEVLRPFDRQWAKEAGTVKETLRRRLPKCQNLPVAVDGGLIFTHGRFSFHADGSCKAWVGMPRSCVGTLSDSSEISDLTMEKRLRVLDALLAWSDRLHEQQGGALWATSSSVELAQSLYEDAVSRASAYLSDIEEPSSVVVGKEVEEARKRVIWHPHPDDPPQS